MITNNLVSPRTRGKKTGETRVVDFLDLPKSSRNRATRLFVKIKLELRKGFFLREFGFRVNTWDNVGLNDFVSLPMEHYLRIVEGKSSAVIDKRKVAEDLWHLYAFLEANHVKVSKNGRKQSAMDDMRTLPRRRERLRN